MIQIPNTCGLSVCKQIRIILHNPDIVDLLFRVPWVWSVALITPNWVKSAIWSFEEVHLQTKHQNNPACHSYVTANLLFRYFGHV